MAVAELLPIPLVCEPDPPPPGSSTHAPGWCKAGRQSLDDGHGAMVQELILRYVLDGVRRSELARQYALSERAVQTYVSGESWACYGRPVLRALRRLGISTRRGERWRAHSRYHEIVNACRATLLRALYTFDGAPPSPDAREQALADLRLLTWTWTPPAEVGRG